MSRIQPTIKRRVDMIYCPKCEEWFYDFLEPNCPNLECKGDIEIHTMETKQA